MSTETYNQSSSVDAASSDQGPKKRSVGKIVGLCALFIFLLIFMTLLKLPQARITSLLQGYVQVALDPYGIYITDRGRELSALHGFRYTLEHPTLEFADQTRVELDQLVVTPKLLPLLQGRMGVDAVLKQGPASVTLEGTGRGDKIDVKLDLDHVDIGRFGVLAYLASLKGSGQITGTVAIAGTLSDPKTLSGKVDLKLKALKLDEQNVMGFQLPPLNISEGTVNFDIHDGKVVAKNVQIGKGEDDLTLNLTGDITLNRFLNSSALNLRAVFGLSDRIKQTIPIIDSFLGPGKMADGKYAYKLTGTMGGPFPIPDASAK